MSDSVLSVRDLKVQFGVDDRIVRAVDGVTLEIGRGETVGLVGETGSGKSVTALSILGLIPSPPGRIVGGQVLFDGKNLLALSAREMRRIRGAGISMIFQEPMTSLDPSFPIGSQLREPIAEHLGLRGREATRVALQMLERVRMPHSDRVLCQYPFELSGGMRQRVMIAMAISCHPTLLIADEATTALDVSVQAQVLSLLKDLQDQLGMSILLITHDLGVVAETCDRVYIMYAGRIVESAAVDALFREPMHPYTQGLLAAIPSVRGDRPRLEAIPGELDAAPPVLGECPFAPRCPRVMARCHTEAPPVREVKPHHDTACFLYG
ncbi:MAG TPA: ABC transporter ATP-binding protein [bacterium]|nr:ABC transporter ATP-binding protein [bacterium]